MSTPTSPSRGAVSSALLLLVACSGEPSTTTSPDELAEVVQALDESPEAAAAALNGMDDTTTRGMALSFLIQERPDAVQPVCPLLEDVDFRRHCGDRAGRPHLWTQPAQLEVTASGGAGGPRTHQLLLDDASTGPLSDLTGDLGHCAAEAEVNACAILAATTAAVAQDAEGAATVCAGIIDERSRNECFFLVAEKLTERGQADQVEAASELCLAAGTFRSRCFAHLLMEGTKGVPPADRPLKDSEVWSERAAYAAAVSEWWTDHAPANAEIAEQRHWSHVTMFAFHKAETVTGDLLDGIPEEHHGHVRAAAAWRLLQLQDVSTHDLAGWVRVLQGELAERGKLALHVLEGAPERGASAGATDLWPPSQPGPEGLTATIYLNTSRRLISDDVETDLAICILEAAARLDDDAGLALLQEGARSPLPEVSWTATRLQANASTTLAPGQARQVQPGQTRRSLQPSPPARPGAGSGTARPHGPGNQGRRPTPTPPPTPPNKR